MSAPTDQVATASKPTGVPAKEPGTVWNSLEVAKILVAALTPTLILWYGQQITSERLAESEAREEYAQVVMKRVELWDKVAGPLNDIYCYFLFVGHWKDLSAADIVSRKRELDKSIYSNRPFFSDEFFNEYDLFMKETFQPFGGWGKDAALRTLAIRPMDERVDTEMFTNKDNSEAVYRQYFALLKMAATELNANIPNAGSGAPPMTPKSKEDLKK